MKTGHLQTQVFDADGVIEREADGSGDWVLVGVGVVGGGPEMETSSRRTSTFSLISTKISNAPTFAKLQVPVKEVKGKMYSFGASSPGTETVLLQTLPELV